MAITAAVTVSPSSISVGQNCTMTVTVTNTGTGSVTVLNVVPSVILTGSSSNQQTSSMNIGQVPIGTGLNVTVPGSSGTLALQIGLAPQAGSTGPTGTGSGTFTLGAQVQTSDGSNVAASTTTLTVNAFTQGLPSVQQTGINPVSYV